MEEVKKLLYGIDYEEFDSPIGCASKFIRFTYNYNNILISINRGKYIITINNIYYISNDTLEVVLKMLQDILDNKHVEPTENSNQIYTNQSE